MNALMIDIETLSLRPTAQVTQIGYCAANLRTGEYLILPINIWVAPHGGHIDMGTVAWWMRQSNEARLAVFGAESKLLTPAEAFVELQTAYDYLQSQGEDQNSATVWGSPAMFDLPILTNMWAGLPKEKPWRYNMERDLMTLYKMLDPTGTLRSEAAIAHDAASDAKAQMDNLIAIFQTHATILEGAI